MSAPTFARRGPRATALGNIFAGAFSYAVCTGLAKAVALGKEVVVARVFGASATLDAYLVALIIPSFVINVISVSISHVLVPQYLALRYRDGEDAAIRHLSSSMVAMVALHIVVTLVLAFAGLLVVPQLAKGLPRETVHLAVSLHFLLIAIFFCGGLRAIWGALLEAQNKFLISAFPQVVVPGVIVVALLVWPHAGSPWVLAGATVAGFAIEAAIIFGALSRTGVRVIGTSFSFGPIVELVRPASPIILAAMIMSGSAAIDQTMVAGIGPASLSTYNFGIRLASTILVLGASLWTVAFPLFSNAAGAANWTGLMRVFSRTMVCVVGGGLVVAGALAVFGGPLISIIFQHGAFSSAAAAAATAINRAFALQIPAYAGAMVAFRLLTAIGRNDLVLLFSAIGLTTKIALNLWLSRTLGPVGIALATPIVFGGMAACGSIAAWLQLRKRRLAAC